MERPTFSVGSAGRREGMLRQFGETLDEINDGLGQRLVHAFRKLEEQRGMLREEFGVVVEGGLDDWLEAAHVAYNRDEPEPVGHGSARFLEG